jgi:hypothetical protein
MPHDATLRIELCPAQARALAALLRGTTVTAAAEAAGVDRATVHRWLRHDTDFQAELNRGKAELLDAVRAELRALASDAVGVVRDMLSPATAAPPPVRLKAALAVLAMVGADRQEDLGPQTPADAERENALRDEESLLDDMLTFRSSRLVDGLNGCGHADCYGEGAGM